MSRTPHVTVVVPVWNAADTIGICLTALSMQNYPADAYDICVVDNGSVDSTVSIVRGFGGVNLLFEAEPSSYAARNRGLACVTGAYVAFTDSDCIPERDWLKAGMEAARAHPGAAIIGGRINVFRPSHGGAVAAAYDRLFAFGQEETVAAGRCATANWLSPVSVLRTFGGFDARRRSGGDFELSKRVSATGAAIVYARDMVVRHPSRRNVAALAARRRRISAGYWQGHAGILHRLQFLAMIPLGVLRDLRTVLADPELSFALRLGVASTVVWLGMMQIIQPIRMMLGASAPRS